MRILRLIAGIILIVLSVVFLIGAVGGIVGIWTYADEAARNVLDTAFAPVESGIGDMKEDAATADAALTEVRETLTEVDSILTEGEARSDEMLSVATDTLAEVRIALEPRIERVQETVSAVRQTAQSIGLLIETLDALPSVSLPEPVTEKLARASRSAAQMKAKGQEIQATRLAADDVADTVASLKTSVSDIGGALDDIQSSITDFQTWLVNVETQIADLKSGTWRIVQLSLVGTSVVLAWIAVCQVGMILHAVRLVRS